MIKPPILVELSKDFSQVADLCDSYEAACENNDKLRAQLAEAEEKNKKHIEAIVSYSDQISLYIAQLAEARDILQIFAFIAETEKHKNCILDECEYKQAAKYLQDYPA